jgi:hypothetical protein
MTTRTTASAGARLLGLALEIPPVAYVTLTGTLPGWARIWMAVWLSLWLLVTVVQATRVPAQHEEVKR